MDSRQTLREVYQLVKAGERDAARVLLKPVLAQEPDNLDAWWLAAHAASNPTDTRLALARVLQLKPDHAPARVMLDRLNVEHPLEDEDLPPVPKPPRKRDTLDVKPIRHRWVWNIVLLVGILSFVFASVAITSTLTSIDWLDRAVDDVGETVGLREERGERGQLGSVPSDNPAAAGGDEEEPIPIVNRQKLTLGEVAVGELKIDEAHVWTFTATHGDEVAVLLQFTVPGNGQHVLQLWDTKNQVIAEGVSEPESATITMQKTLSFSGTYSLVLIGRPGGPHGGYALGVDLLQ